MKRIKTDLVIIGSGIVGVATALQLKTKFLNQDIIILEKESDCAHHQTGHNSGVVHAGVYYEPGSLKAEFCKKGAAITKELCLQNNLPFQQCGKMLVATSDLEMERMENLRKRCIKNKINIREVSQTQLKKMEPNIIGKGALFVKDTAITDYIAVTRHMVNMFKALGGKIYYNANVTDIKESGRGVMVNAGPVTLEASRLIACGGLMADRLTRMMDIDVDFRIIPFRGEYYQLPVEKQGIVKRLIYPIPDPELPFLGVHLTPMVDGAFTVGPNAVLGWKREGYGSINFSIKDVHEMMKFSGFWKVVKANLKSGINEMIDSVYRRGYLKRVQKYCPQIELKDLTHYPAGIRAQAVMNNGSLVHDFLFAETERSLHVCNAPSPAATSAMPIGEYLMKKAAEKFGL
ncbi:L-2-hydroxyglutarate oxidase [Desulfobacter hydrogenophilus]|uniref:L-2-hydroxyglutarate oxidase n=1 Tax=Desulfobacter hydrogenophilus TaxID=2291 RepID=A0A328FG64_9BACT|nr:L-2-hydroxyglutarate oxidase [Desulfobacter hydrogenophilus]NDY71938.1 L-2-hydroxyglutarate oxidase [Desulfobacter hydrogenophilus]QBH12370.1 L-2-hydroxyglutarate oxidase [Desulfobacter hydrogenophilus]RAM02027.1 L-2-hydroxyglutarate oxidase [Desulfobacter hydrogenophilus]